MGSLIPCYVNGRCETAIKAKTLAAVGNGKSSNVAQLMDCFQFGGLCRITRRGLQIQLISGLPGCFGVHSCASLRSEKLPNRLNGHGNLFGGGLRTHRQRDDFVTDTLGFRCAGILEPESSVFPHGLGPVNQRLDALGL